MIHTTLDGKKIVLFGHGSIKVTSAYIDEKGMLALQTNGEMPIGTSEETNKTYEQRISEVILSEILMEFENIKSLEVLILKLQEVRAMMLGYDTDRVDDWKRNNNITTIYQPNPMIDGRISCVDGAIIHKKRTNREAHEDAAGMSLDGSFFARNGIDPDAEYVESPEVKNEK